MDKNRVLTYTDEDRTIVRAGIEGVRKILTGNDMDKNRVVTYTDEDRAIVRAGIEGVRKILMGNDMDRKRSMLFCLDYFMDPYYGQDISAIRDELVEMLQQIIVSKDNDTDVKEDAIDLLGSYEWGPYPIIDEHFDEIEDCLKPDVNYIRKMHIICRKRKVIFLGSSVTYGEASGGISFADMICERTGWEMIKEAVSGTTLADEGPDSYVSRMKNIKADEADLLVCQLSTNDATLNKPAGEVGESDDIGSFDTKTVAGAIEYIIAYARRKWGCYVMFYTSPRYDSRQYGKMVKLLKKISVKWQVPVIDMWSDRKFNAIDREVYDRYMADPIHPTLEGYREWLTPYMEKKILDLIE